MEDTNPTVPQGEIEDRKISHSSDKPPNRPTATESEQMPIMTVVEEN